tara:strand:+ start:4326 stop:5468 length:1143 start_codon:yes stop_codon:yes gene_type:complete
VIINSKKRPFGIGSKVSAFTLGTMRAADSPEKMYEIIKQAYYAGINHIETAPSYGKAEYFIGEALYKLEKIDNINRLEWIITSKILPKGNIDELKNNLYRSLKALKVKKINNLAIHGINLNEHLEWVYSGEVRKFISWTKDMKFVDQIGFSSHGSYELINNAIDSDIFNFCNLHLHLFDKSKIPLAKKALKKNMGVLAISPADKGGKLYAPSNILEEASEPFHPLEIAYRFLLANGITTLSLGARKAEDFEIPRRLANATNQLTNLELKVLSTINNQADKRLGSTKCEQCRACMPCPSEIPIPEILRLRNISIGHGQIEFAKERYNLIGRAGHWWESKNGNDCNECNLCISKCPHNLNIPELLIDTHSSLSDKPKRRLWG